MLTLGKTVKYAWDLFVHFLATFCEIHIHTHTHTHTHTHGILLGFKTTENIVFV